jgi:hypothetical protein
MEALAIVVCVALFVLAIVASIANYRVYGMLWGGIVNAQMWQALGEILGAIASALSPD